VTKKEIAMGDMVIKSFNNKILLSSAQILNRKLSLALPEQSDDNARLLQWSHPLGPMMLASCNGDLAGPLAIMICKPRQARKGATVAVSYVPGCGWLGYLQSSRFTLCVFTLPNLSVFPVLIVVSAVWVGVYFRHCSL